MKPYVVDHRHATDASFTISSIIESPAGKNGFVKVKDGHLVKPDGTRIRLWGVNITDWTRGSVQFLSKADADFYARTLARYGINCVRLTFLDFFTPRGLIDPKRNDTRHLDSLQLDKLDYWIAALKKNGIYTDLNLLVGRIFKEGDGVVDFDKIGWAKFASYFDPQLIKLQKEFANDLLTHLNPYTGNEYRNETAVVIVELVNENTLFDAWHRDALHPAEKQGNDPNFRNLTHYYSDMLTSLYNVYLGKSLPADKVSAIRKSAGIADNQPVPRLRLNDCKSASPDYIKSVIDFYTRVESDYFIEMRSYLKETLNLKSLLIGSNDFLHNQSEYPMIKSNSELDIIDGHVYWQHPSWPGMQNTPMVNYPDSSTVVRLARTALKGKPYTVTEVNNAFPNDYECEAIPLVAAYGSLQDWDAVMWYTFEPKTDPEYQAYVGDAFDISLHPVKMPQMAAGSLIFLRGDVTSATNTVKRNYTPDQLAKTMYKATSDFPYYTKGFNPSLVLKHKVRIGSLDGPETGSFEPLNENPVISDTRELSWSTMIPGKGFVTINTPKSQGMIGFIKTNMASTTNLKQVVLNDFCSITLSSLDNKPISTSDKILLITGAKVTNTDAGKKNDRTLRPGIGKSPSLIEPVIGSIYLTDLKDVKSLIVHALDGSGSFSGDQIKVKKTSEGWGIPLGKIVTTWYLIDVIR